MSNLIAKLKLDRYQSVGLINCPETYLKDFSTLNRKPGSQTYDLILLFTDSKSAFVNGITQVIHEGKLEKEGLLYIAYPKKGNSTYPDYVHRDEIFDLLDVDQETGFIQGTPYKFNRMVGLDDTYTVLGLKHTDETRSSTGPSQSVRDYLDRIDEVKELLQDKPEFLALFSALTPGYQRDWARHIFSTENPDTRAKRLEETARILSLGYKSLNLYRQAQKNR